MLILQRRSYGLVYRIQGAIEWLHYHVKLLFGWSLSRRSSTGIITQKIFACLQETVFNTYEPVSMRIPYLGGVTSQAGAG